MKNGTISEQLHLQEQVINSSEMKNSSQENLLADIPENKVTDKPVYNLENLQTTKQSYSQPENETSLGSLISFTSSGADYLPNESLTDEELRKLKNANVRKAGKCNVFLLFICKQRSISGIKRQHQALRVLGNFFLSRASKE